MFIETLLKSDVSIVTVDIIFKYSLFLKTKCILRTHLSYPDAFQKTISKELLLILECYTGFDRRKSVQNVIYNESFKIWNTEFYILTPFQIRNLSK